MGSQFTSWGTFSSEWPRRRQPATAVQDTARYMENSSNQQEGASQEALQDVGWVWPVSVRPSVVSRRARLIDPLTLTQAIIIFAAAAVGATAAGISLLADKSVFDGVVLILSGCICAVLALRGAARRHRLRVSEPCQPGHPPVAERSKRADGRRQVLKIIDLIAFAVGLLITIVGVIGVLGDGSQAVVELVVGLSAMGVALMFFRR